VSRPASKATSWLGQAAVVGIKALGRGACISPRQPKEIVIVPGGHFDAYVKSFEVFSGHARDWFTRYLAT
jgi:hypothetical protein